MTATTYWARLVHGNKRIDLDEEPYQLAHSFTPPAMSRSVMYAEGSGRGNTVQRIGEQNPDKNYSINIRILGDTEAEILGYISRLSGFLSNAADTNNKLYLEYYPYAATGRIPLWGQGVFRYTIRHGDCTLVSPWTMRDRFAIVSMTLRLAPFVEGQRQKMCLASGGIYEDTIKTADGISRGVQVCTAGTNIFTNPIFSHVTWNTGWTATADLLATQITDPDMVLFGENCAKIQNNGGTAGTANYTTTMTTAAATYVMSAYVRLLDERAPGTADMQFLCRGTALGAFNTISVGDSWYRIWDTATCPAAAGTAGIKLMNPGAACYIDGFQMEVPSSMGTAPTPLMYGDALGCAWSSTRGASTTVRTAGALKLPISAEVVNSANSSLRVAAKWNIASNNMATGGILFSARSGTVSTGLYCGYGAGVYNAYYGVSGALTCSGTFSAGDIAIMHICWGKTSNGSAQFALYVNGILGDSDGVIDLGAWDSSGHFGQFSDNTLYSNASILDFTIFDRYLTAAEVAADYAQVYAHVNGGDGLGQRLNPIPYLWTKDGDNVVDSYNDSTHDDFAIAAGIPGNQPAHTVFDMRATFAGTADGGLFIANQTYKDILDETNLYNGTDVAQALGTALVSYPSGGTVFSITRQLEAYRNQKVYFLTSLLDAGTTSCRGRMVITTDTTTNAYYSDVTSLATDGTAAWYLVGPMIVPDTMPREYDWMAGYGELNFYMQLQRTSGTGTVTMSELRLVPGQFCYVPIAGLTTNHAVVIDELRGYAYNSSTSKEDGFVTVYGDPISLIPGVYNHLVAVPMKIGRDTNTADTLTFSRVYVTPRYSLL